MLAGSDMSEVVMGKMEAFERAMPGQYAGHQEHKPLPVVYQTDMANDKSKNATKVEFLSEFHLDPRGHVTFSPFRLDIQAPEGEPTPALTWSGRFVGFNSCCCR